MHCVGRGWFDPLWSGWLEVDTTSIHIVRNGLPTSLREDRGGGREYLSPTLKDTLLHRAGK